MKIYTKTGDSGETGLFGGKRLPKHHLRIEAYGTVDELNAHLGMICDLGNESEAVPFLREIQNRLFVLGSLLAAEPGKTNLNLPELEEDDILKLEQAVDKMDEVLPPMRNFILPGGSLLISQIHIARTVCRRAERCVVALHHTDTLDLNLLRYLNRLSDYLFTLGRYTAHTHEIPEIPWIPFPKNQK